MKFLLRRAREPRRGLTLSFATTNFRVSTSNLNRGDDPSMFYKSRSTAATCSLSWLFVLLIVSAVFLLSSAVLIESQTAVKLAWEIVCEFAVKVLLPSSINESFSCFELAWVEILLFYSFFATFLSIVAPWVYTPPTYRRRRGDRTTPYYVLPGLFGLCDFRRRIFLTKTLGFWASADALYKKSLVSVTPAIILAIWGFLTPVSSFLFLVAVAGGVFETNSLILISAFIESGVS